MMVETASLGGKNASVVKWTQLAANSAVVGAAAFVVWLAIRPAAAPRDVPRAIYAVGDHIDPVGSIDFRRSAMTLVMFVRKDCQFCRDSLPFYERLSTASMGRSADRTRLVVASTDDSDVLRSYLLAHRVQVDEVATVGLQALKITGTPTLLLVDGNGIVMKIWRGWLSTNREEEVFDKLGLPARR